MSVHVLGAVFPIVFGVHHVLFIGRRVRDVTLIADSLNGPHHKNPNVAKGNIANSKGGMDTC